MSCPFTHEELEDRACERLPEPRAHAIDEHVATCRDCRDELDWLRLERMAFEERQAAGGDTSASLWEGIAAELATEADEAQTRAGQRAAERAGGGRRVFWFGSGFAAAAMAAAVLLLYVRAPDVADPQPQASPVDAAIAERVVSPSPDVKPSPVETLTEAESQYEQAISTLEAEFEARRADLPDDVAQAREQAFEHGRELIEAARREAGDDVDAHMLVLDAYSSHLRTVQAAMSSME